MQKAREAARLLQSENPKKLNEDMTSSNLHVQPSTSSLMESGMVNTKADSSENDMAPTFRIRKIPSNAAQVCKYFLSTFSNYNESVHFSFKCFNSF